MSATLLLTVNVQGLGPERAEAPGTPLFGRFAHGGYTGRIGLTRLLDALRDLGAPATFFWPSTEAEVMPALLERCLAEGHEIAAHGHDFEDHMALEPAREEALLEEAHATLARLTGSAPVGFRAPTGTLSANTLPILARLGYRYDSSFVDDDAPYPLAEDGGGTMMELPWSEGLADATHFRRRLTQDRAETMLNEELDALLPVAGYALLTLHPRADLGLARAARLPILRRLVERAAALGATPRRCRDVLPQP
ncbi:polysaccharide deacetylase family protein [Pararoseomonas indoligenes]|uniref:Chitooligosaccharide deacetylase n=1 Tax=Roseomonas indoligenes TaxID=2820811 RepID=A0A940S8B1_9PROT|nr:polysaccharide deacetylase family protein [Pararoseomonas indoligenes]MBP0495914.1 polysaccharide deacetylase family protein [Pararoseomonas indoligenes]